MPRTKPRQDREEKRAELVEAARRLFVEDGFEATSMAALARAAGVVPNTIYWYFDDKDAVLVAVLEDVLADALTDYAAMSVRPLEEQVVWVVGQLLGLRRLVATVHARIGTSEALNAWHDAFHAAAEGLLRGQLAGRIAPGTEDAEVRIAVFAVEGLLTHDLEASQRADVCRQLAARWPARRTTPHGSG